MKKIIYSLPFLVTATLYATTSFANSILLPQQENIIRAMVDARVKHSFDESYQGAEAGEKITLAEANSMKDNIITTANEARAVDLENPEAEILLYAIMISYYNTSLCLEYDQVCQTKIFNDDLEPEINSREHERKADELSSMKLKEVGFSREQLRF